MTRKRNNGAKGAISQQVKDITKQVRQYDKTAKELLRKAGKDIREVRGEVAKLKKAGVVSARINARNYVPTRYMLSKIKKNADIISGEVATVRASKAVRQMYVEKGIYEARGNVLIVPRDYANQKQKIQRGLMAITRPLAMGEETKIILPFKATDMENVAERLKNDPTLDGLKNPDELFGFTLFGHAMATIGFPDADELADYILRRYAHLFSGKNGKAAVKNFVLFRFKSRDSQLTERDENSKVWDNRKKRRNRGPDTWSETRRKNRDILRKQKERAKETPEQKQERLDKQRRRSALNRQRKFDEK